MEQLLLKTLIHVCEEMRDLREEVNLISDRRISISMQDTAQWNELIEELNKHQTET